MSQILLEHMFVYTSNLMTNVSIHLPTSSYGKLTTHCVKMFSRIRMQMLYTAHYYHFLA
jgi:hypothetical protein